MSQLTTTTHAAQRTNPPKTHAAAAKAQRQANMRLKHQLKAQAKADRRRRRDDDDRAYFARWPMSVYPGQTDPTRGLEFTAAECPDKPDARGVYRMNKSGRYDHAEPSELRDEWRAAWRRLHERWQRVRARMMRLYARTPEDKVVIYRTSLHYRDMRRWELRRVARASGGSESGWNESDPRVWDWWAGLTFKERFRIIASTWLKGIRPNNVNARRAAA